MPPRRRHRQPKSVARLQSGRLPVGTHVAGTESRPSSQATDHSDSSFRRGASSDFESHDDTDSHNHTRAHRGPTSAAMSSATIADIADAKLRRQQERIQQAEAALQVPHHHHQRPLSRAKGKTAYKPLDIDWDTSEAHHHPIGDTAAPAPSAGPVAEVRINTYSARPFSRDTSISRSLSSVSQQTGLDLDRQDSFTDDGFQTYRRGRPIKNVEQLKPFEDKPEQRQKTVEAEFDKRQIYEVFAKELPGLDYIESTMGHRDGQVQFIQHPNGDVSAHIWSEQRTLWENLGSFSNIRKRIEGQLAADRLKGETGWQTLQKHTLAYFRAVAKQRECTRMGIPFGQADIQQLLPPPKETAPSTAKQAPALPSSASISSKEALNQNPLQQRPSVSIAQPTPRQQGVERFISIHDEKSDEKEADPFAAAGVYAKAGHESTRTSLPSTTTAQPKTILSRGANIDQTSSYSGQQQPQAAPFSIWKTSNTISDAASIAPPFNSQSSFPFLNTTTGTSNEASRRQSSFDSFGSPSRVKPVTPLQTREAMRDQLWKLGETARSRNPSQTNIPVRTVLRDPYQRSSNETDETEFPSDPPSEYDCQYPYSGMPLGWIDSQPALPQSTKPSYTSPPKPSRFESSLADSVPDNAASSQASTSNAASTVVGRPQLALVIPESRDNDSTPVAAAPGESKKESLQRWWTSGTKFARHEELYQSIKNQALLEGSTATTPARTNPRPIGAPPGRTVANPMAGAYQASPQRAAVSDRPAPFNETITRAFLLIHENLSSYVQGPSDARNDYWAPWVKAPEWAIDRSPGGNDSFFDNGWGKPPARVGRDPRYRALPGELRFGGFSPGTKNLASPPGLFGVSGGVPGMSRYGYGSPAGKY